MNMNKEQTYERYERQLILQGFGMPAQQKLQQAKVLVIGAGGLGCPVLQYLAAAGVGTIGIADDDVVSLSNLHRQVLYSMAMIGELKATCAANVLQQLNPQVQCTVYTDRITNNNVAAILSAYDLVIDGSDNFATRYLVNDACVILEKPLVYGAVSQYEGQVAVFNVQQENDRSVNYRDMFPHPPKEGDIQNCEEAGVLGVVPGIIGTMMANEAIKLITHTGEPLINQLLTYDTRTNQLYQLYLPPGNGTRQLIPADIIALEQTDYLMLCNRPLRENEIDSAEFSQLLERGEVIIVDVRNPSEQPFVNEFAHLKIPLDELPRQVHLLQTKEVVLFCQSGRRSMQAVGHLVSIFGNSKKIYSLAGGILSWKQAQTQSM
jgi:sulfur-carrier protein adenylyltransferase/sulfurtransferase